MSYPRAYSHGIAPARSLFAFAQLCGSRFGHDFSVYIYIPYMGVRSVLYRVPVHEWDCLFGVHFTLLASERTESIRLYARQVDFNEVFLFVYGGILRRMMPGERVNSIFYIKPSIKPCAL